MPIRNLHMSISKLELCSWLGLRLELIPTCISLGYEVDLIGQAVLKATLDGVKLRNRAVVHKLDGVICSVEKVRVWRAHHQTLEVEWMTVV